MMKSILLNDHIITNNEINLVDMLLRWLELMRRTGRSFRTSDLLPCVRWMDIPVDYIKSELLSNAVVASNGRCVKFLTDVISFRLTGIPFDGLLTFHRPTVGLEKCTVIVSVVSNRCNLRKLELINVHRIRLQHQEEVMGLSRRR